MTTTCEITEEGKLYNYVLAYLILAAMGATFIFFLVKNYSKGFAGAMKMEDMTVSPVSCVSPKLLFLYRSVMVVIFFPVAGFHLHNENNALITFTLWNWILFGFTFFFGALSSFRALKHGSQIEVSNVERIFQVLLEVLLPSTIFIAIVVWVVLVPDAVKKDEADDLFTVPNYFMHGLNVAFTLGELFMDGVYFDIYHVFFAGLWTVCYGLFHTSYMVAKEAKGQLPCPVYGFLDMTSDIFLVMLVVLVGAFMLMYVACKKISDAKRHCYKKAVVETVEAKQEVKVEPEVNDMI